jgi:ABC-2 type transport system ATP-binding protein
MTSPMISISSLCKSYQNKAVLEDLDWQVEAGDIVALLGENGAGKSTLLESIMNLRTADAGQLKLWDKPWVDLPQEQREKIGFVAQDTAGFEWMRVQEFLSYLGSFFPGWDLDYCESLRQRWNLDAKKKVGDLSGGQTQILHVIQALSIKPELLILDEPVAHLDPRRRRQFIAELVELTCELNTTVIFSSHIISDLERVANKVALLKEGNIQYYTDVDQLKASIAHVKIAAEQSLEQSIYYAELINWQTQPGGATATIAKPLAQSLDEFVRGAPHPVEVTRLSLEDWYLEVSNECD